VQSHRPSIRSPPVIRPTSTSGGCPMTNLKLRALPYAGVLTLVASMAGYIGTR
jgi:hypothetical protein